MRCRKFQIVWGRLAIGPYNIVIQFYVGASLADALQFPSTNSVAKYNPEKLSRGRITLIIIVNDVNKLIIRPFASLRVTRWGLWLTEDCHSERSEESLSTMHPVLQQV